MKVAQLSQFFKSLSDDNRIMILKMLKDKELCACKLLDGLNLSQSGLSYHMKILTDIGLVKARPEGKWIHYRLNQEQYGKIIDDIVNLID